MEPQAFLSQNSDHTSKNSLSRPHLRVTANLLRGALYNEGAAKQMAF